MNQESNGSVPTSAASADVQYNVQVVKAIRGREASTRAKLENQGWEFVSESKGTLRTEMTFRKPKPKTAWAVFRGLPPKIQRLIAIAVGALVVVVAAFVLIDSQAGTEEPAAASTEKAKPSTAPSTQPNVEPSAEPSVEPSAELSEVPSESAKVLTAKNNPDVAALLKAGECDDSVASFASQYEGKTIQFAGSVVNMANHDGYDTRWDILLAPGDKGPNTTTGPIFKYENVNFYELNVSGADEVAEGGTFVFEAEMDEYNADTCLLFLTPVSTESR